MIELARTDAGCRTLSGNGQTLCYSVYAMTTDKHSHSKTLGYAKVQRRNLRGQAMDLLVNKVVPLENPALAWSKMTLADDRHTGTRGGGSRKAGGHSERHYRKAQTEGLREASCFLELPEPLKTTPVSASSGGLNKKRTPLWHLNKEKFLAFLGLRDMGRDERVLPY